MAAAPPALAPLPGIRRASVDPQPAAKPDYDIHKNLRDFQAAIRNAAPARSHGSPASPPKMTPVQKELPKGPPLRPSVPMAVTPGPAAVEPERLSWIAGKSILLTRTLSGLIDMLAVAGCSALFLGVSVGFGKIDVLSPTFRPALWGAVLFFQAFYSTYFLLLAGRTPGMMLTGLKVVNEQNGKARAREVILRSLLFFVSCAPLMLGLLWGIWDRRSRCMHDALSHTRVVRC
ncbi:MAG: RDD family protein [Acidobacteria bacterium]|nr:RDD family protein [Acidobacteriota bacterium]